jgi:hypothetical protein
VDVGRFGLIASVEEEAVRTLAQHRRRHIRPGW